MKGARPEVWAYGFAIPAMGFDRQTGELFVAMSAGSFGK